MKKIFTALLILVTWACFGQGNDSTKYNAQGGLQYFPTYTWFNKLIQSPQKGGAIFGGYTKDTSALLELKSTKFGFLMPRMTSVQRTAIILPARGLQVYDLDSNKFCYYTGSAWICLGTSSGGGGGSTGPTGPTGVTGATGTAGTAGATGPTGAQGITGPTGTAGGTGGIGATGPTGSQGITGATGIQGATGPSGATGVQGVTGLTGATGIQGITGASGSDGSTGATGSNGVDGANCITWSCILSGTPTVQQFYSNQPVINNVTFFWINHTDVNSIDETNWLLSIDTGTLIQVTSKVDHSITGVYSVNSIDSLTSVTIIGVSFKSGSGTLVSGDNFCISFSLQGAAGLLSNGPPNQIIYYGPSGEPTSDQRMFRDSANAYSTTIRSANNEDSCTIAITPATFRLEGIHGVGGSRIDGTYNEVNIICADTANAAIKNSISVFPDKIRFWDFDVNSYQYNFPKTNGGAGETFINNGSGTISWGNPAATAWALLGNAGTNPAVNFIGTTDEDSLVIKVAGEIAGLISTNITSYGRGSLESATTASANSAFGYNALLLCDIGVGNSAFGNSSGSVVTSGSGLTLIGSITNVTSGTELYSTGIGYSAKITASNQFVLGSSETGQAMYDGYFGNGVEVVTSSTPQSFTFHTTNANQADADVIGADMNFQTGLATGNAISGNFFWKTGDVGSSGTTQQTPTTKMALLANGNVGIGTSTPLAKLHVNGTFLNTIDLGSSDSVQIFNTPVTSTGGFEYKMGIRSLSTTNTFEQVIGVVSLSNTLGIVTRDLGGSELGRMAAGADGSFEFIGTGVTISAPLLYNNGSPGVGKVLTSDASGNATWQPFNSPTFQDTSFYALNTTKTLNVITVGGTDKTYNVAMWVNVTAISVNALQASYTYTDQNSASHTVNTTASITGTGVATVLFTPNIRCKAGTTITATVTATGIGSETYDAGVTFTDY